MSTREPGSAPPPGVDRPWARPAAEVAAALDVDVPRGLADAEVARRRARFGPNRLREARRRSVWAILLAQFESLLVALLAVAAAVSFAFGDVVEGLAIVAVLLINAAIGFLMELRAVRSMEALRGLAQVAATVRRDGTPRTVAAQDLVPGDVVLFEGGDVVTADLRLVEASKLQANESALTGESVPVEKRVAPAAGDAALADRTCMLFKGTAVTRGSGEGVVVATGMATELGGISALVDEAEDEDTPLEKRLNKLGQGLVWVTLAVAALVTLTGIGSGKDTLLVIETAIALAVAAVPEGLPIVATIALARGMRRMARHHALVNRLSAVETLGATSVLCTDKTGTLTENQMTVTRVVLPEADVEVEGEGLDLEGAFLVDGEPVEAAAVPGLAPALEAGLLCNNASLEGDAPVGDPMEVALLVAAAKAGLRRPALLAEAPEVREVAFDPDLKLMATVHGQEAPHRVAVKGAAEAVVPACTQAWGAGGPVALDDDARELWLARSGRIASQGARVLALAEATRDRVEGEVYQGLTLLGLVALQDPPREDVPAAIRGCREAGVQVVMVTGDHPETARRIAHAVGLVDDEDAPVALGRALAEAAEGPEEARDELRRTPVFARVSPRDKLDLIALHQEAGAIVAMTGDGVNDAPALKKADIGVAMGVRGTEVAREAADMILQDDALQTIVFAIRQGRVIFDNIRAFVVYLLSCNISEILVIGIASAAGAPLPLLPLQILFLNLVTDVFPALALGASEGSPGVMDRPPRGRNEPIVGRREWRDILVYGLVITAAVLGAFAVSLEVADHDEQTAVTVAFLTLGFSQLVHVFNMRGPLSPVLVNEITRNPSVWGAVVVCTGLLLAAVYAPGLSGLLDTTPPDASIWGIVAAASVLPALLGPPLHGWRHRGRTRAG